MINPVEDQPVSLSQFARLMAKEFGTPVHQTTVRRWCEVGVVRKEDGQVVRLETIRMPWGLATSRGAYQRFIRDLNRSRNEQKNR